MPSWELLDTSKHRRSDFDCGVEQLNKWLTQSAKQWMKLRATRVHVLPNPHDLGEIVAFYSLSTHTIRLTSLPEKERKRRPRSLDVPAILIGQLAVAKKWQGKNLGGQCLFNALSSCFEVSKSVGVAFIIVDAIDDDIATFYQKFGFQSVEDCKGRLFMPMQNACELLAEAGLIVRKDDAK